MPSASEQANDGGARAVAAGGIMTVTAKSPASHCGTLVAPSGIETVMNTTALDELLARVRDCRACADSLPLEPRPVVQVSGTARLLVASQAPGTCVQASGIPFSDDSGERLRDWMGVPPSTFYDPCQIAVLPMGFCYPGRMKGGDAPPRKECSMLWRQDLLEQMPSIRLTLLVGTYAQSHELGPGRMTDRVRCFREFLPSHFPLPHPSWRVRIWSRDNPWFEQEVLPALRIEVQKALAT